MEREKSITHLLNEVERGSEEAYNQVFERVYEDLKRLAYSKLQKKDDFTLTETALLHEVYLKMIDQTRIKAEDKNHFLAIGARCMRQILIDHARKKKAKKRGGNQRDLTYIDELFKVRHEAKELIDLHEKLKKLARLDERMAEVVTLRFFGQMTVSATADALGVSKRTVKRDWAKARGWLYKEIKGNKG